MSVIPAGYRMSVVSWENDGDHYLTRTLEGLRKDEVHFYLDLCKLFKSENQVNGTFGNMYCPSTYERAEAINAMFEVMRQHKSCVPSDLYGHLIDLGKDDDEFDPVERIAGALDHDEDGLVHEYSMITECDNYASDIVFKLIGTSEDYAYRVFERATVEYCPVQVELQDVTHEFIK